MKIFYDINIYMFILLGVLLGSFLNVLIYRLPRNLEFSKGRSMCPHCNKELRWIELIPIISYAFLLGHCSKCKTKISIQYPLVECLSGVLFGVIYWGIVANYGKLAPSSVLLFISGLLIIIGCFTDFLYHGVFDFTTKLVCALLAVYIILTMNDLKLSLIHIAKSLVYTAPIVFSALCTLSFRNGKKILTVILFIVATSLTFIATGAGQFDLTTTIFIMNSLLNFSIIFLIINIADYLLKLFIENNKLRDILTFIREWLSFILFFIFITTPSFEVFTINAILSMFTFNIKNITLLILCSMLYIFMKEMAKNHNDSEDIIEANDDIIEREENTLFAILGDGDILILPAAGLLLGISNLLSFYVIMGMYVSVIYYLILRKKPGTFTVPLYPFIMISIGTLYCITFV